MNIDHFMWGAPTLAHGIEQARELFGVEAAYGGPHIGLGTHNALLSLGDVYLEIIAPDPEQSEQGGLAQSLAKMETCGLITWAATRPALAELKANLKKQQIDTAGPVPTSRRAPDGTLLEWELLFPTKHSLGSGVPFFIDWLECQHPSAVNPAAGQFTRLNIESPEAVKLAAFFAAIGLDVDVQEAADFAMRVDIARQGDGTPVSLTSTPFSSTLKFF